MPNFPSFLTQPKEFEIVARAGADGSLRCVVCDLPVTIIDPEPAQRGQSVIWLDADAWVEDGVPKARCRAC